jgi:hypothetical protein
MEITVVAEQNYLKRLTMNIYFKSLPSSKSEGV